MKNLKQITFVILAAIGAAVLYPSCKSGTESGTTSTSGPIDLKLNFKTGEKFLYSTRVDQNIESMGNMSQSMLMEMIYTYTGDEGGDKKLAITYDHVVMHSMSPMGKIDYDSKDTQPREKGTGLMDSLIGKSFTITVAPNGEIKKVEGMSDLINAMAKTDGGDAAANAFSDTTVRLMMQNSFDIYPGKPVKTGDTWVKKTQMGFATIKVDVENTYTLKSIDGNKATIAVTSVLSLPKTKMGPGGSLEMNGTQKGTVDVDVTTGQILSGKTAQDIKGNMIVEGMQQPIPMNIKGDITITSKKL
jgi:hypothetical protein